MFHNLDLRIIVKEELGLTWAELAEQLGVSISVLSSGLNFELDKAEKEKIINAARMLKEIKDKRAKEEQDKEQKEE